MAVSDSRTVFGCLLTRNSEKCLALALESLAPSVDRIVAVDACSTDGTASILRKFGATVIKRPWPGSFVTQTQVWLDYVRSQQYGDREVWVLQISHDEILQGMPARQILDSATGSDRDHVYLPRRWLVRSASDQYSYVSSRPHCPDWQLRMFRVDDRVHWAGGMHGTPWGFKAGWFDSRLAILHLDFLVTTPAERVAKVRRYEQQEWLSGLPRYYLIERYPCMLSRLEISPHVVDAIRVTAGPDVPIIGARPLLYRLLRPYVALEDWVFKQLRLLPRAMRKLKRSARPTLSASSPPNRPDG